ncbi:hypothetical protein [Alkalibacterium kapii]|uniref:Uncharacterized protein n=1 Tax=Alkalibacterium kapii TaxID=426704 RepID=A0A511ASC5_9LACT|nr:hypothetical protein [Alkalibacterium kapii]GEK91098.1 hypothetical protein AKA01nite_07200 [Alkalibacterium kapii]
MYESWIRAEQFYTFMIPLIIIVLLFLTIVFVLAFSYTEPGQRKRKVITLSYLALLGISAAYFIYGHLSCNDWIEQNEHIDPGVRASQTILGIETREDPTIVKAYRRSDSLKENLLALDMYEAEEVTRPFDYDYAGAKGDNHYFTYGKEDQYVFILQGEIDWSENQRELKGIKFTLTDKRFGNIGFYSEPDVVFDSLSLPKSEQRELGDVDLNSAISINEMISGWNFGRQFY